MQRIILLSLLACLVFNCASAMGQAPAPAPATAAAAPLTFDQQVVQAINFGKQALYKSQLPNGSWPGHGKDPATGVVQYPVGPTALAVYALLEAGENPQSDKMKRALDWLSTNKADKTYEVALRCNAWLIANRSTDGKYRKQLDQDAKYLEATTVDGSYSYPVSLKGGPANGDNSNSQYGLLGMWAAARSLTYEVSDEYWWKVMRHWLDCQNVDGAWGYTKSDRSSGTMATAGVASLFVCYDNLFSAGFIKCETNNDFKPIQRGLDWFDKNFDGLMAGKVPVTTTVGDWFYLLYGVERVGLASGYKYFGTSDWYKLGADFLLKGSKAGGWAGGFGGDVSTSYALLFLVRGRNAVLFNKLEYPSVGPGTTDITTDWNCRPRDLAMLTSWISRTYETTVNWQIINLKVDVKDWHDAPILYISGSREPKFDDKAIEKLRAFVLQGGTIFSCTECGDSTSKFAKGIRETYRKVFPDYEMVDLNPEHDIYQKAVHFELKGRPKFSVITNGIRPLVIHTDEDLPKAWQLNRIGVALPLFQAAANVFMYVTDKGVLHSRASRSWPDVPKLVGPRGSAKIVRLKWTGNWNPEPLALERFSRLFSETTKVDLQVAEPVVVADVAKAGAKLAILGGEGKINLNEGDLKAIKEYVNGGGTILVDAAGGDAKFAEAVEKSLDEAFGVGSLRKLAMSSSVYNITTVPDCKITDVKYRRKTNIRKPGRREPALMAISLKAANGDDRPAVIYSREDISSAGLVGYQSYTVDGYDPGEDREGSAYRLMQNIMLYAIGELKAPAPAGTAPAASTAPTATAPVAPATSQPAAPATAPAKTDQPDENKLFKD